MPLYFPQYMSCLTASTHTHSNPLSLHDASAGLSICCPACSCFLMPFHRAQPPPAYLHAARHASCFLTMSHCARLALYLRRPIYMLAGLLAAFSGRLIVPGLLYASPSLSTCYPACLLLPHAVSSCPACAMPLAAYLHTGRPASCFVMTSHRARPELCLHRPIYTLPGLLAAFSRCFIVPGLHYTSVGLHAARLSPDVSLLQACTMPLLTYHLHAAWPASCFLSTFHHAQLALCLCRLVYTLLGLLAGCS